MNTEISYSEAAVDTIDSAADDFRRRLCRAAEQLAHDEGLSVVSYRHIVMADSQLTVSPEHLTEEVKSFGRSVRKEVDKSPSVSKSPRDIEWPALDAAIGMRPRKERKVETLTLQETREETSLV